jgi:peptide/nickel transport system ATP-binding protein
MSNNPMLSLRDFSVSFDTARGPLYAVRNVDIDVADGESVGIVGESGSGKTVLSRGAMGLLPKRAAHRSGTVIYDDHDLSQAPRKELREYWGTGMAMIFQDPMTALNPVRKIGTQLTEGLRIRLQMSKTDANARGIELLNRVRIPDPAAVMEKYPFQLSGGMRQRVMIAMALACNPKVLIADEPTTALDVTIQAQILNLMLELKERLGTAIVLITHDLGVVAETAQRAIVMYAGLKVEEASVGELFSNPLHPYTRGLMASIPRRIASGRRANIRGRLPEISGIVPSLIEPISGCAFAPRCSFATERCKIERPQLQVHGADHLAACWEVERVKATPR